MCGVAGCNANWDPTQNLLAFVAGSSTNSVGFSIQNSSVYQGAIYAVNEHSESTGSDIWGPIVARQVFPLFEQHDEPLRAARNAPRGRRRDLAGGDLDRESSPAPGGTTGPWPSGPGTRAKCFALSATKITPAEGQR